MSKQDNITSAEYNRQCTNPNIFQVLSTTLRSFPSRSVVSLAGVRYSQQCCGALGRGCMQWQVRIRRGKAPPAEAVAAGRQRRSNCQALVRRGQHRQAVQLLGDLQG